MADSKHVKKQWKEHIKRFAGAYAQCLHSYDLAMNDYCNYHHPLVPLSKEEFYDCFPDIASGYFKQAWALKMEFNKAITEGLVATTRQGRTTFAQNTYAQLNLLGVSTATALTSGIHITFDDPLVIQESAPKQLIL